MLLTLTAETQNATDLGYLLYKNPANLFTETLPFGELTVFYPEVSNERCTMALLLELDPIGLIRSDKRRIPGLDQYVNDRPYVASSLMSVALNAAFSTAMNGRSKDRPERVEEKMNLTATVASLRATRQIAIIRPKTICRFPTPTTARSFTKPFLRVFTERNGSVLAVCLKFPTQQFDFAR